MTTAFEPQRLRFASVLPATCRRPLERLVFFHPRQGRMRRSILDHVHAFGAPRIVQHGAEVCIAIDKNPGAQNLFAMIEKAGVVQLLGFVLYVRNEEWLDILFIAVRHAFTAEGRLGRWGVTYQIMDQLKRIGGHVKGVAGVRLKYRAGPPLILKLFPEH